MTVDMPPELRELLLTGHGVFTGRQARRAGVSEDRIQRLVRDYVLVPVARGTYAAAEQLRRDP